VRAVVGPARPTGACAVAAVLAAGCTITLPGADAGSGTGTATGTDATTQTVNDQCIAIANEFCSQAVTRCGSVTFTQAECVANDMSTCCQGSSCNATSSVSASTISACTAAIDKEDCNLIANSMLPAECPTLPL
jgi:hypothetical protein